MKKTKTKVLSKQKGNSRKQKQQRPNSLKSTNPLIETADLFSVIGADLAAMGHAGEEKNAFLLYLAAISRRLPEPSGVCLLANSGGGKSELKGKIMKLQPKDEVVSFTRMTENALSGMARENPYAVQHKLIAVEENHGAQKAFYEIRTLLSEKTVRVLSGSVNGSQEIELHGPVAFMVTTTPDSKRDEQTFNRMFVVEMDASADQTREILRMNSLKAAGKLIGDESQIIQRHHEFQASLLRDADVVIPFAERIQFPFHSETCRREHTKFLKLIKASAYLHQNHRKKKKENGRTVIFAAQADFDIVCDLVEDSIMRKVNDLNAEDELVLRAALNIVGRNNKNGVSEVFTRGELIEPTGLQLKAIERRCEALRAQGFFQRVSGARGSQVRYEVDNAFAASILRRITLQR